MDIRGAFRRSAVANLLAIILVLILLAWGHAEVSWIIDEFTEMRRSDAIFLSKLVSENRDGITTISEAQKSNIIENLSHEHVAVDIEFLGLLALIFLYLPFIGIVLDRVIALVRIARKNAT